MIWKSSHELYAHIYSIQIQGSKPDALQHGMINSTTQRLMFQTQEMKNGVTFQSPLFFRTLLVYKPACTDLSIPYSSRKQLNMVWRLERHNGEITAMM